MESAVRCAGRSTQIARHGQHVSKRWAMEADQIDLSRKMYSAYRYCRTRQQGQVKMSEVIGGDVHQPLCWRREFVDMALFERPRSTTAILEPAKAVTSAAT
eukprot:6691137-Prymnesium_polylepis.1